LPLRTDHITRRAQGTVERIQPPRETQAELPRALGLARAYVALRVDERNDRLTASLSLLATRERIEDPPPLRRGRGGRINPRHLEKILQLTVGEPMERVAEHTEHL
jgi:hypothetical protein